MSRDEIRKIMRASEFFFSVEFEAVDKNQNDDKDVKFVDEKLHRRW